MARIKTPKTAWIRPHSRELSTYLPMIIMTPPRITYDSYGAITVTSPVKDADARKLLGSDTVTMTFKQLFFMRPEYGGSASLDELQDKYEVYTFVSAE